MRINSLISDNSSYHKLNVICLISKFANKISTIRHWACSTMRLSSASIVPGQNRPMCTPLPASYHPPNSSSCKLWNHLLSSSASRTSQHFLSLASLIADQPWAPRFVRVVPQRCKWLTCICEPPTPTSLRGFYFAKMWLWSARATFSTNWLRRRRVH